MSGFLKIQGGFLVYHSGEGADAGSPFAGANISASEAVFMGNLDTKRPDKIIDSDVESMSRSAPDG